MSIESGSVTALLTSWRQGDPGALRSVMEKVYPELCHIASQRLRHVAEGETLEPAALVNEVYLRLLGGVKVDWQDRNHFFAIASLLAREVLVDLIRKRRAIKRHEIFSPLDATRSAGRPTPLDVVILDDALKILARDFPLQADVVQLRYFAGLTVEEIADYKGISRATVERAWVFARAWLFRELGGHPGGHRLPAGCQKKKTAERAAAS